MEIGEVTWKYDTKVRCDSKMWKYDVKLEIPFESNLYSTYTDNWSEWQSKNNYLLTGKKVELFFPRQNPRYFIVRAKREQ